MNVFITYLEQSIISYMSVMSERRSLLAKFLNDGRAGEARTAADAATLVEI